MEPEAWFEEALQALLDRQRLPAPEHDAQRSGTADDPLRVIDAISRASCVALFGTEAPPDAAPISQWGHLEVREEIGRGASGTVHRAWDTRLTRHVALKLLPSEGADDALAEGRLLARLNHSHIVRVFGADTHDGRAGIWMELLEGETLDDILAHAGRFGPDETLLIGLELVRALAAVHAAGLLHRDIKTRNVMRERGGRIVLMDLSASRTLEAATTAGDGAGTPMYMAPEVLAGASASERSDIYSLGVVLYRLLTGAFPYDAANLVTLRAAQANGWRQSLAERRPDVAPEIAAAVDRCCNPNPLARYAGTAECEAALVSAWHHAQAGRTVPSTLVRWWARRRRAVALVATMAISLLLIGWTSWDTTPLRALRRAARQPVPPRSPLYVTVNGGIGIVRGGRMTIGPFNPTWATVLAVSTDLGVRTLIDRPPAAVGAAFRLDGTPVAAAPTAGPALCCWIDGTTDGRFNYAVRQETTLLDPIGSRRLAPPSLYRFERDWSNPRLQFPLDPAAVYAGVTFDAQSNSFWFSRTGRDGSRIERWSADGKRLSTPVIRPAATFKGIAFDPVDRTLWVVRSDPAVVRLENFDTSGRHLGSFNPAAPINSDYVSSAAGAEFAFIGIK
jgi:hypothetical protein